jgi:asparagine synthase (glutamine-hydrolysing)
MLALDGAAALDRVRGMFAIALWDADRRSLLLARDRFGMKPLYVAADEGQLTFASEIGALVAAGVPRRPSPAGILAFLSWGSIPAPLTWLENVTAVEPGSWLRWCGGDLARGAFADTAQIYGAAPDSSDDSSFVERVAGAVRDSVAAHLVADVPVGVFLSGGIDSGAIVSAAAAGGATRLQTFTVTVSDQISEAPRAREVAHQFATEHHELAVDGRNVVADFPLLLRHLDQPTIDGVNSFYVSRAVAQTGIKAVLSGAGGDELFAGYPSFRRIPAAMRVKRGAGPWWPTLSAAGRFAVPDRLRIRWDHFAATNGSLIEAYRVQRGFFMPAEIDEIAGPALQAALPAARAQLDAAERASMLPAGAETPTAAIARLESRLYLRSQLLRDIDAMGMAHGLEVRTPFVDHRLLETVWPHLGTRPSLQRHKRLLVTGLARPLPTAVTRAPKQGFTLPFAPWMTADLAPLVDEGLRAAESSGWIARGSARRLVDQWQRGAIHWSRPWGLAVLGHFVNGAA